MSIQKGKFVHEVEVPVRWVDMDAFGHVNNSTYLTYFELARIGWWHSITPPNTSFSEVGPVVINAYCTFHQAIIYPEILRVRLYVGSPGRSSYECYYEIHSVTEPNRRYADGSTKVVWVDRNLAKSIPLPDFIKTHLPA